MRYKSSALLMLRQFLFTGLIALGAVLLIMLALLDVENTVLIIGVANLALVCCLIHVIRRGFVNIEVDENTIAISRPGGETVTLPRGEYAFTSRVVSHSVNLIPVSTERTLVAYNDAETLEIPLPNLSKKTFDNLLAALRRDQALAASEAIPEAAMASFILPKEEMLRDFRKLVAIFALAGVVASLSLAGILVYLLAKAGNQHMIANVLLKVGGFCALMFVGFGIPVLMTYRQRERATPAAVSVGGDRLDIGDDSFSWPEIRRVVATPPEYVAGDFVGTRKLAVWTDRGKSTYHFGVRRPGGIWKAFFEDYGALCVILEAAVVGRGGEFVYDL